MKQEYEIVIRGLVPDGLSELISGIHAFAILRNNNVESGNKKKMSDLETPDMPESLTLPVIRGKEG